MQWTDDKFRILGLGHVEKAILAVTNTAKSVQEIHAETGISRTGIKYELERLIEKGLARRHRTGKRFLYVSASISDVARMFESISHEVRIEQGGCKGCSHQNVKRE